MILAACCGLFASTINLDNIKSGQTINLALKNGAMNLLEFPFIVESASIVSQTPESFNMQQKHKSVLILVNAIEIDESADLVVFSDSGKPYMFKITTNGSKQQISFVSNSEVAAATTKEAKKYETGKIVSDITRIYKTIIAGKDVPGFTKTNVRQQFNTADMTMQKEVMYDGTKYRVETWYLKNVAKETILLDASSFYTEGILSIAFEYKLLQPKQVGKMWLILDKATLADKKL